MKLAGWSEGGKEAFQIALTEDVMVIKMRGKTLYLSLLIYFFLSSIAGRRNLRGTAISILRFRSG